MTSQLSDLREMIRKKSLSFSTISCEMDGACFTKKSDVLKNLLYKIPPNQFRERAQQMKLKFIKFEEEIPTTTEEKGWFHWLSTNLGFYFFKMEEKIEKKIQPIPSRLNGYTWVGRLNASIQNMDSNDTMKMIIKIFENLQEDPALKTKLQLKIDIREERNGPVKESVEIILE